MVSYTPILLTVSMSGPLPLSNNFKSHIYVQIKRDKYVHSFLLLSSPILEIYVLQSKNIAHRQTD